MILQGKEFQTNFWETATYGVTNYPITSYFQYYHKINIIETNTGRNFAKIATKMKLAHFPMALVANYLRKI